MDQYLEVLAFSDDLVYYVFNKWLKDTENFVSQTERNKKKALSPIKRFNKSIGLAVYGIMLQGENTVLDIVEELENMMMPEQNIGLFNQMAIQATDQYFPRGYSPVEFLAYCAAVAGSAVQLYHRRNVPCADDVIFEAVAGVIGTVLCGHMITARFDCSDKSWQEMTEVAEMYIAARNLVA